jgi:hypothetical protein
MLGFTGDHKHHFPGETQRSVAYLVVLDPFNPTYAELSNSAVHDARHCSFSKENGGFNWGSYPLAQHPALLGKPPGLRVFP